jgi:hypothetical protein
MIEYLNTIDVPSGVLLNAWRVRNKRGLSHFPTWLFPIENKDSGAGQYHEWLGSLSRYHDYATD